MTDRRHPTGDIPLAPPRGFSLIELLVVIMIIALLLGILLPILPRVRDSARRAACAANLHSLGHAIEMYKGDNKDKFPVAKYMPPPWLSGDADPPLNTALDKYIPADSLSHKCPGDSVVYDYEYTDAQGQRQKCGMSYTYVIALSGIRFEDSFFARFLQRSVTETPVAYDYDGGTFETQDGTMVQVGFFHDKRNILFVDSHVGGAQ